MGLASNWLVLTTMAIEQEGLVTSKRVTLPRLELMAALLGTRLLRFVREALELPYETPFLDQRELLSLETIC